MAQPGYEGFAALGDMLLGGADARAADNANTYRKQAFNAADAFWEAKQRRARALIDEARLGARTTGLTPDALAAAGYDPKMVPVLAGVLGAAETPDMRRLGDFADPADQLLDKERREALEAGDVPRYNRVTALQQDKDYQPVRTLGGAYIADGVNLGDLDAVPTPESLSRIEENEAQARAALIRANKPPAARASKPSATSAEADVLAQARAAIGQGAPKAAVQQRLRERGYSKLADRL